MKEKVTFEFDPVEIGGDSRFSRFLASVDWRQTMVVDWDAAETWEEGQFLGGNGPRHRLAGIAGRITVQDDGGLVAKTLEALRPSAHQV